MTRIILRFLNSPALIFLTLIGIAIQTSFFTFWMLPYFQPDIVLLVVLWCALRRHFLEGGILTLILATLTELHSASPRGLYMITYMAIYLLVRLAARLLVIPDFRSYQLVTIVASIVAKLFSLGIVYLLGISVGKWDHLLRFMIPGAFANGLIGQWVFKGLNYFDQKTFKNIRINRLAPIHSDEIYLEDEYQMENSEI